MLIVSKVKKIILQQKGSFFRKLKNDNLYKHINILLTISL